MSDVPKDVKSIFLHAVEQVPPDQWPAFVGQACGDDSQLRRQVQRLLDAYATGDRFMAKPAAPMVQAVSLDMSPITEQAGTMSGPYKLVKQIGTRGMGLVFLARQQSPVERNVALKIIKAGMDTREVIARFEAERQALALMDHPNIARDLDAGSTESGRPYFVMDMVRGTPITDYCDRQRLATRQRLELIVTVCQAVQHAHQKGVIHRDIKPSNVRVTLDHAMPVPKVVDFGVAKATGQQLTEESVVTGYAQLLGTPLYMSPEQAAWTSTRAPTSICWAYFSTNFSLVRRHLTAKKSATRQSTRCPGRSFLRLGQLTFILALGRRQGDSSRCRTVRCPEASFTFPCCSSSPGD